MADRDGTALRLRIARDELRRPLPLKRRLRWAIYALVKP